MDWDAWVYGELSFRGSAMEQWKKSRVRTDAWARLPAWIRPTAAADARVSRVLANIKGWSEPLWRYIHAPDCVSVLPTSSSVSVRAYLTGAWFSHFAGQLAALAVTAADVGAEGELVFVDVRTGKGFLFQLDGAHHLGVASIDVTDPAVRRVATEARDWMEGKAQVVAPDLLAPHPERRWSDIASGVGGRTVEPQTAPHWFRNELVDAGAVFTTEWDLEPHHFEGAEAEVARAQRSCAIFDVSHASNIRVSHHDPERFLASLTGESSTEPVVAELTDPETRTYADRALLLPHFGDTRLVRGSALDRGRLYDWLHARSSEVSGKGPTIEMPLPWGAPGLCFVGPDAPAVAADILAVPAVAHMKPGMHEQVVRADHGGVPTIWASVARDAVAKIGARCKGLFAGTAAEDRLDALAGRPPRPRWTSAHQEPWRERAMLQVPALAEAETRVTRRKR